MITEAIVASVIAGSSVCSDHFDNVSRFNPTELSDYQKCVHIVHENNSGVVGNYVWVRNGFDFVYINAPIVAASDNEEIVEIVTEKFIDLYEEDIEEAQELLEQLEEMIISFPTEEERRAFIQTIFDINNIDVPIGAVVLSAATIYDVVTLPSGWQYQLVDGTWYVILRDGSLGGADQNRGNWIGRGIEEGRFEATTRMIVTGITINGTALDIPWFTDLSDDLKRQIFEAVRDAYNQGYRDGYEDGYTDGYADGYVDGFRDGVNAVNQ